MPSAGASARLLNWATSSTAAPAWRSMATASSSPRRCSGRRISPQVLRRSVPRDVPCVGLLLLPDGNGASGLRAGPPCGFRPVAAPALAGLTAASPDGRPEAGARDDQDGADQTAEPAWIRHSQSKRWSQGLDGRCEHDQRRLELFCVRGWDLAAPLFDSPLGRLAGGDGAGATAVGEGE